MFEWYEALTTLQKILFVFGGVGTLLFLIQTIMMTIGLGDTDADLDVDGDVDMDVDGTDVDATHADSDIDFKIVSVQGTVAFFMMLGWIGLAMNRSSGYGTALSLGVGAGAGLVANFIFAKAMQFFKRMQSSGTMDLRNAIGQEGNVYLNIKADEPGKVQMAVQGHLKVFEAVSDDNTAIPTDTRVVVVRLIKGNTMVVKRV